MSDNKYKQLRDRAEQLLDKSESELEKETRESFREIIHELKVYQIELELQNEELLNTQTILEETKNLYYEIFNFAPVGYIALDENLKLVEINLAALNMLSVVRSEVLNKKFTTYIFPESQDDFYFFIRKVSNSEENGSINIKINSNSGKKIEVNLNGSLSKSKLLGKYWLTISDITSLKLYEEQNKFQANLLDLVGQAIIGTDLKGIVNYWNKAAEELYGYKKDEAIGKYVSLLNTPEKLESEANKIMGLLRSGKRWEGEFELLTKDRKSFTGFVTNAPVFDEKGEITGMVGVSSDISEKKKNEEKIKNSEAQLRKLNATKDKFFSIIAHDLRNPFNIIIGLSEILRENAEDFLKDELIEISEKIYNNSNIAFNLLENLLEWSRAQTGGLHYELMKLIVNYPIYDNINIVSSQAKSKNITILFSPEKNYEVYADKNLLGIVIRNLLTNAIKFSHSGGEVRVDCIESDEELSVSVRDNGIGIKEADLEKLFKIDEKFVTPGTNKEKGTGLGLLLCKEFVELMNGKISVKSEPEKGSVFSFTLPKYNHK